MKQGEREMLTHLISLYRRIKGWKRWRTKKTTVWDTIALEDFETRKREALTVFHAEMQEYERIFLNGANKERTQTTGINNLVKGKK